MKYFVSTDQQIKNVKAWNKKYGWGFTDNDFKDLPKAPEWPSDELAAVVLVPYLKTLDQSVTELLKIVEANSKYYWQSDSVGDLELFTGVHTPGLRWEVIEFKSNQGQSVETVRKSSQILAGVGAFATAAHFPDYLKAMDGTDIPYMDVPGISVPGHSGPDAPYIVGGAVGGVRVRVYYAGNADPHDGSAVLVPGSAQSSETKPLAALSNLNLELDEITIKVNGKSIVYVPKEGK